jgi:two-component system KDP operon response regulator KdpE
LGRTPEGRLKATRDGARPVLLIEDDAETRESMRALLAGAGHRVIASDEGRKALELAAVTRPALVVLDLATQGMNGWEFLERKVDEPALLNVPVIVVTGSKGAPPRSAAAVFRKPVDPDALLDKIRALLRPPRP